MKRTDDQTSVIASVDQRAESVEIGRVLDEFLVALEAGESVDPQTILDRYPEWAAALSPALQQLVALHSVSRNLDSQDADDSGNPAGDQHTLGDFRILREIGRGGMGVVYEAEQISLGRRVALKMLPLAAVLDERQLARFKNEARAAAMLRHTNIVSVLTVGCERGVHFYAMQYIEGYTLAQVIVALRAQDRVQSGNRMARADDDSPLTASFVLHESSNPVDTAQIGVESANREKFLDDILVTVLSEHQTDRRAHFRTIAKLGIQAADALEHAHQHGVVHRDVKPANLMLDAAGNLSVTDFGLARLESDAGMTITGDVIGTLRYMSPEQALGKQGLVDHRTDIYSLGVTLYELLTLRSPFSGDDRRSLLREIAETEPHRPQQFNPAGTGNDRLKSNRQRTGRSLRYVRRIRRRPAAICGRQANSRPPPVAGRPRDEVGTTSPRTGPRCRRPVGNRHGRLHARGIHDRPFLGSGTDRTRPCRTELRAGREKPRDCIRSAA